MADEPKVLGQSAPGAAANTNIYTVPGATEAVISSITVCNRSAVGTAIRIMMRPAGAGLANQHYLVYDLPIGGNDFLSFTLGVGLEATDVIDVYNTLATCTFQVLGMEIT